MRLYILVRGDLSRSQQAVQAGHALAQAMLDHPAEAKEWNNYTLVYLRVKDEQELTEVWDELAGGSIRVSNFTEPDIENQMTAIACFQYSDGPSTFFDKFQLL